MSVLDELRTRAELTLNRCEGPWLPYEETWHEMTSAVLLLLDVADAVDGLLEAADAAPIPLSSATAMRWDDLCRAFARLGSGAEERAA